MEKENQEEKKVTEQMEEAKLTNDSEVPKLAPSLMLKQAFEDLGIDSSSSDFNEEQAMAALVAASKTADSHLKRNQYSNATELMKTHKFWDT